MQQIRDRWNWNRLSISFTVYVVRSNAKENCDFCPDNKLQCFCVSRDTKGIEKWQFFSQFVIYGMQYCRRHGRYYLKRQETKYELSNWIQCESNAYSCCLFLVIRFCRCNCFSLVSKYFVSISAFSLSILFYFYYFISRALAGRFPFWFVSIRGKSEDWQPYAKLMYDAAQKRII